MRSAVLAVRLGELAGASAQELVDTYYVALLHSSGCTSDGHEAAQLYGDDIVPRAAFCARRPGQSRGGACVPEVERRPRPRTGAPRHDGRGGDRNRASGRSPVIRDALRGRAALRRLARLQRGHAGGARVRLRALGRVGFPGLARRRDPVADAAAARGARHLGLPLGRRTRRGARGRRAPVGRGLRASARGARRAALRRAARRAGRVADLGAGAGGRAVPAALDRGRKGRRRLRGDRRVHRSQVAVAARAFDGRGRARRGRRLADGPPGRFRHVRAPRRARARPRPRRRFQLDLGEARAARLRRVGARATASPLHGARLRPVAGLAPIGVLAGSNHERLDGSGYHRNTRGPALDQPARILAAADCYRAMREARPYRPALDAPAAEAELLRDAREGGSTRRRSTRCSAPPAIASTATARAARRIDRARAGGPPRAGARGVQPPDRRDLGISAKTVGHHIQHVYQKVGVRSRAAATLWAFEHDLVRTA